MSSFGKVLRQLRKQDGLTQTDLGKALGISYSAVSMYERGEREPDFEMLEVIADYFNVSMDYLHAKETKNSPGVEEKTPREQKYEEIISLLQALPEEKVTEAVRYLRYLAEN